MAIDAALYSRSKCYFFKGNRYIRVTRGDTGPGTVDSGYPAPISNWGWPGGFGSTGIDAALYSRSKCYFFKGNRYIRVTRGDTGPGTVDSGLSGADLQLGLARRVRLDGHRRRAVLEVEVLLLQGQPVHPCHPR